MRSILRSVRTLDSIRFTFGGPHLLPLLQFGLSVPLRRIPADNEWTADTRFLGGAKYRLHFSGHPHEPAHKLFLVRVRILGAVLHSWY